MVPATDTLLHSIFTGDVELIGLVSGLRRVAKKEGLDADAFMKVADVLRADGWAVERNARLGGVYISRDPARVARLLELENLEFDGGSPELRRQTVNEIGQLLEYPDCCAAAFADLPVQDDSHVMRMMLDRFEGVGPLPWQLNFLVPMAGPVFYYPCSPDCPASLELARRYLVAMESASPGWVARTRSVLARPMLVAGRWDFLVFDGQASDEHTIEFRGWQAARDFHPVPPPSSDFAAFIADMPRCGTITLRDGIATATDCTTGQTAATFVAKNGIAVIDYR